jgi:hypothetical protein
MANFTPVSANTTFVDTLGIVAICYFRLPLVGHCGVACGPAVRTSEGFGPSCKVSPR